ncbi:hypothetical protein HYV80_05780 [Candidatus Woesearchaeota archaeon]|nr:hypothetical protein [Candidatus Woesearchaeota archaeon]
MKKTLQEYLKEMIGKQSVKDMTIEEVMEALNKIEVTNEYPAVRKALEKLVEKGLLIKTQRKDGKSTYSNGMQSLLGFSMSVLSKTDIDKRGRIEDLKDDILIALASQILSDSDNQKMRAKFKEIAPKLKDEDPVELYGEFAVWLVENFKKHVKEYLNQFQIPPRRFENEQILNKIQRLSRVIYNRQFGITFDAFKLNYSRNGEDIVYEAAAIKKQLKKRIVGKTFLEKIEVEGNQVSFRETGTDASVQKMMAGEIAPASLERNSPIAVITAVSVIFDLISQKLVSREADPEPKDWTTYSTQEALSKGLLIPPLVYIEDPNMWERTLEASMDLRLYNKDLECFGIRKDGQRTDIIFRDGRIFPLEHRFEDYIDGGHHGEFVRWAMTAFRQMVSRVADSDITTYCGVVKLPRIEFMSPLIFWYMIYKKNIWNDLDPETAYRYVLNPPISDNGVILQLFSSLAKELRDNDLWMTCKCIRLLKDSSEEEYSFNGNFNTPDELQKHLEANVKRKGLPYDVSEYAELCFKASVASFYIWKSHMHNMGEDSLFTLPRYEIMLSHQKLEDLGNLEKHVKRVAKAIIDPRTLEIYTDLFMNESRIILPGVIQMAHQFSHDVGVLYKKDFMAFLFRALVELKSKRAKGVAAT